MSTDAAHKSWWQITEVVFGVSLLVALALQLIVPISFPRGHLTLVEILGGAVFIILSVTHVVLARREFAKYGQPTDPGHPTGTIVTSGVFSISRNPIYLGAAIFMVGVALAFNLPWVLVLLLPSLVACHYILIAPEERYLAAKFGQEYRSYTASVQRWLGRIHQKNL